MFLVVGGDSEIGASAHRALRLEGKAVAATTRRRDRIAPDRPFLDLAAPLQSWQPPRGTQAACLCAAIARLAACASDPQGSARINVTQTVALAEKLLARDVYVLFLSTNQVFDGSVPHTPADAPRAPQSEYGRQKARAEAALQELMGRGAPVAILRLAKVVSTPMPLLEDWMRKLAAGTPIRAFNDLTLAPTPTEMVCAAISALLEDRASGIFQLTGPRDVSYAEVGRFLAGSLGADPALVEEASARAGGLPEGATPANTTLDSSLMRERYGFAIPDVWQVVEAVAVASRRKVASPINA
jgi:dTDP-4-dehydrorhamnose reductase